MLEAFKCSAVQNAAAVQRNNGVQQRHALAIKNTPVIFVMEFSSRSLNDTVSGQRWRQLITLRRQQHFLGIWAAVLQSILACSSSVEKKDGGGGAT